MKIDKADVIVATVLVLLVVGAFALTFFAERALVREHGSYLKCDYRGVKGTCMKWSKVSY